VFWDLKFDLSEEEVFQLAAKVRTFCQEDMKAFAFLSLYLQISVAKLLESKPWKDVEKEYIEVLKLLEKKYPANNSELPVEKESEKNKKNN